MTIASPNVGSVLVFRTLTGFFGSPALANGGATIADIYAPKHRAYAIALWGLFAVCSSPDAACHSILSPFLDARPRIGTVGWRLCGSKERMDLDDLGAHMAFRPCLQLVPTLEVLMPPFQQTFLPNKLNSTWYAI